MQAQVADLQKAAGVKVEPVVVKETPKPAVVKKSVSPPRPKVKTPAASPPKRERPSDQKKRGTSANKPVSPKSDSDYEEDYDEPVEEVKDESSNADMVATDSVPPQQSGPEPIDEEDYQPDFQITEE